jgi:hypothetical protein
MLLKSMWKAPHHFLSAFYEGFSHPLPGERRRENAEALLNGGQQRRENVEALLNLQCDK